MNIVPAWSIDDLFHELTKDVAEHGLQCAYELSMSDPDDFELQLAGLFHDVAHRLPASDELRHGVVGAALVRPTLGQRVASLVELHVPAKRFLVATDPSYQRLLSPDSVATLMLQGGPMSPAEAETFLELPNARDAVTLRRADDRAKQPGRIVPNLDHWRSRLS